MTITLTPEEERELVGYIALEEEKWKSGPFCTVYPGVQVMRDKAFASMQADKIRKRKGQSMTLTLDEWADKYASDLRSNLKANIHAMTDMPDDEQASLLRLHLIMVRQWAQDRGLD